MAEEKTTKSYMNICTYLVFACELSFSYFYTFQKITFFPFFKLFPQAERCQKSKSINSHECPSVPPMPNVKHYALKMEK